jgi:hypothetical protein
MTENFEKAVKKYGLEDIVKKHKEKVKLLLERKPDLSPSAYRDWIKMMPFFTKKEFEYLLFRKTPLNEKQLENNKEIKERIKYNLKLVKRIKDEQIRGIWEVMVPIIDKAKADELIQIFENSKLKENIKPEDLINAVVFNKKIEDIKNMLQKITEEKKRKTTTAKKKRRKKVASPDPITNDDIFLEILNMCKSFTNEVATLLFKEISDIKKDINVLKKEIDDIKSEIEEI